MSPPLEKNRIKGPPAFSVMPKEGLHKVFHGIHEVVESMSPYQVNGIISRLKLIFFYFERLVLLMCI